MNERMLKTISRSFNVIPYAGYKENSNNFCNILPEKKQIVEIFRI